MTSSKGARHELQETQEKSNILDFKEQNSVKYNALFWMRLRGNLITQDCIGWCLVFAVVFQTGCCTNTWSWTLILIEINPLVIKLSHLHPRVGQRSQNQVMRNWLDPHPELWAAQFLHFPKNSFLLSCSFFALLSPLRMFVCLDHRGQDFKIIHHFPLNLLGCFHLQTQSPDVSGSL